MSGASYIQELSSLSRRLSQASRARGFTTLQEAADAIGITRTAWSFYLTGARSPSAVSLIKISKTLNVSVDWLLGIDDEREGQR